MADNKAPFSNYQAFETYHTGYQKGSRLSRMLDSARLGLTVLALLASLTIVGTSADTISVYNSTHATQLFLALWPNEFSLRPTVALVVCGAIVVVLSTISVVASKVGSMRNTTLLHQTTTILTPLLCLIAALVGTSFFYGVNASSTTFTLQTWTCQWSAIDMDTKPHWSTLCKESKAALYLTAMLIPLEVIILGLAACSSFAAKKHSATYERKGSPAMS